MNLNGLRKNVAKASELGNQIWQICHIAMVMLCFGFLAGCDAEVQSRRADSGLSARTEIQTGSSKLKSKAPTSSKVTPQSASQFAPLDPQNNGLSEPALENGPDGSSIGWRPAGVVQGTTRKPEASPVQNGLPSAGKFVPTKSSIGEPQLATTATELLDQFDNHSMLWSRSKLSGPELKLAFVGFKQRLPLVSIRERLHFQKEHPQPRQQKFRLRDRYNEALKKLHTDLKLSNRSPIR